MILVIGLAVNQAILLVDGVLQRSRQAGTPSARTAVRADIILAACRDRAGMIMLVTLTTLASLIPLAVVPAPMTSSAPSRWPPPAAPWPAPSAPCCSCRRCWCGGGRRSGGKAVFPHPREAALQCLRPNAGS
ncbi:MAG: efflux RND transporter permease subunit [Gemmatimonadetes bacterium]|nr:efflux RND transporter permease subunit [Gemmatimonadota bacterium]